MAVLELLVHVGLDHVHGHVARAFNHGLHIVFPRDLGQLAQGAQFGKLRFVVGIVVATRTQAIAQAKAHVVGLHDFANLFEVRVQEVFFMVGNTPFRQNRTTTADNASAAVGCEVDKGQTYTRVDGEVVHPLFGLLNQGIAEDVPSQVFGNAAHFF